MIIELSTKPNQIEVTLQTPNQVAVTLLSPNQVALSTQVNLVHLSTQKNYIELSAGVFVYATTEVAGKVELATEAEAIAGTDAVRAMTPATTKAATAVNVANVIHSAAAKATPVNADEVGLIDSAASWVLKKLTWVNVKATLKTYFDTLYTKYPDTGEQAFLDADHSKLDGIETAADVTDAVNIASSIHGVAGKATPVDADEIGLIDSAAAYVLKVLTWANVKATLKTYFDSLYQAVNTAVLKSLGTTKGDIIGFSGSATPVRLGVGTNAQVLVADSVEASGLKWSSAGSGDVSAGANITDHQLVRGDGGVKGVQESTIVVSDDGEMTNPSQPAFSVTPTTNQENMAINVAVTLIYGTEVFDRGNNFASNTFTAPVGGLYQLNIIARLLNIDSAATYYQIKIVTSNREYSIVWSPLFTADLPYYDRLISILADMDANDTAYVTFAQIGGTAQVDHSTGSFFMGVLTC